MLSLQKAIAKMETIKMLTVRQTKMKEIEKPPNLVELQDLLIVLK